MSYRIEPIGFIKTCFPEKFGIPRQSTLAPSATGRLHLLTPYNQKDCVEGLNNISHLWLTFIFHKHTEQQWKTKVRPPRLGGNQKIGVFASRSSFRPNSLGLSLVKLEHIELSVDGVILHLSGIDLVDGTPIVDIKPYIPYADSIADAYNHIAPGAPTKSDVIFSPSAELFCRGYETPDELHQLIVEVLQQDPRPAYQAIDNTRLYKMSLMNVTVEWNCEILKGRLTHCVIDIYYTSIIQKGL